MMSSTRYLYKHLFLACLTRILWHLSELAHAFLYSAYFNREFPGISPAIFHSFLLSFTLFYSFPSTISRSFSLSLRIPIQFFKAQHWLAMQTLRLQLQANSAFALSLLCFYLSLSALLCQLRHSPTFPCTPPHLAFNYKSSINHNWKIKRIKRAHVFAFRSASIALFLSHSFYVCSPCVCVCVAAHLSPLSVMRW